MSGSIVRLPVCPTHLACSPPWAAAAAAAGVPALRASSITLTMSSTD